MRHRARDTFVALVLLLIISVAAMAQNAAERPMELNVPLQAAGWQAHPEQVRPQELPRAMKEYGGVEPPAPWQPYGIGRSVQEDGFYIYQHPSASLHTMIWTRPLPNARIAQCHYFMLEYAATGIARSYAPLNALAIVGPDAAGKEMTTPLLPVAEVLNDDRFHAAVGEATFAASGVLRVQLGTNDSVGRLRLRALKLLSKPPALARLDAPDLVLDERKRTRWEWLDLGGRYNDTCAAAFQRLLDRQGTVIDGLTGFLGLGHPIWGVPFKTGGPKADIIRPAETKADEDPIEFLGVKTTRHYVRPPGRDDTVAVEVNRKAQEVLFVMISEMPKGGSRYALPPGPHDFNDIGALSVELQYDGGEPDIAFPYSVADQGFSVYRMAGVYAVAADPKRTLKRFILHNRVNGNNHSLAAVTLNVAGERLLPELAQEPPPVHVRKLPSPKPQQPYLREEGHLLKLGNSACDMVIDCSQGFRVSEFVHRHAPGHEIGVHLQVSVGDVLVHGGAFRTKGINVTSTQATISLASPAPEVPLDVEIRIAVDDQPEVRFGVSARNTGDQEIASVVCFPLLDTSIGMFDETWMCFPQYRTVISDQDGSYLVGNDRSFPMQFVDIFNPTRGFGVGLMTRNTDLTPLQYGMGKGPGGIDAYVQSTEAHSRLQPGQTLTMPETVLLPHAGDWHVVMERYKQWLASAGAATRSGAVAAQLNAGHPAPERDWFRKLFAMRVHLTKKAYSWAIPIFDPDTKQYHVDEFMKADTDYLGLPPQIVHLGGWCDYDNEQGGDFLGGDYAVKDYTGGADNLRAAIRKLQDEHHIPVSLYMIPDRCRKTSEIGQRLGRKVCTVRADGWVGDDGPLYYTCCAYPEWRDHYVEAARRTQRELGVKAIYVDVFGFSQNTACYSTEHGHAVPSNPNEVNRDLISRIREALPPEVAVWSEFPLDDMNARYLDGNINYYCLNWHEYFSETYDQVESAPLASPMAWNAYRFAFPDIRQFVFLCGSENWSSECKFPFFNGEPLHDVSWFLYAGPNLDLVRKALALQTKYVDCFTSPQPTMAVPTEKWEVHANEFPGDGRTAWTIYNARYTTVSGPVLKVPHVAGATYYDAWNDRPLRPAISGKSATISLRLEPQSLGCIIQARGVRP